MEVLPDAMVPVCSPAVVQLSNKASISALENPSTARCRIHLGRRRSEIARLRRKRNHGGSVTLGVRQNRRR
jgi:hypothetical protein